MQSVIITKGTRVKARHNPSGPTGTVLYTERIPYTEQRAAIVEWRPGYVSPVPFSDIVVVDVDAQARSTEHVGQHVQGCVSCYAYNDAQAQR